MKIEHITNTYIKFDAEIIKQLFTCSVFSIATAFINSYSINLIEDSLKKNKTLKSARLLIGVYQNFNRQKDLFRLNELANKYPHLLQVHISLDRQFHWKYYHFESARNTNLYVGSANFTSGGLQSNGEIILKLSDNKNCHTSLTKLIKAFDKELINSKSISLFPIDKYNEQTLISMEKQTIEPVELKDFFSEIEKNKIKTMQSDKAVVTYLTGSLTSSTEKALKNHSPEMINNDLGYFVCNSKSHFEQCVQLQNLLIITRESRNTFTAFWSHVVGSIDTIKTDDGKYFIFYKMPRKETEIKIKLESILKTEYDIDLRAYKKPFLNKVIGKRQVEYLKKLIK